jgi:hypothetical protein
MRKYEMPEFLKAANVNKVAYERWLRRRAQAHVKRDRGRGNKEAIGESYRKAIHDAVLVSNGLDAYTGEKLKWALISQFDNSAAKNQGRSYKQMFALLPTVDHIDNGLGNPHFKICSWRTNDVKNDLTVKQLIAVCQKVLEYQGYTVTKRQLTTRLSRRRKRRAAA